MDIPYGVSETIGSRDRMEDATALWMPEGDGLFAAEIYDGHGGRRAASLAAALMTPCLRSLLRKEGEAGREGSHQCVRLVREAYLAVDGRILEEGIDEGAAAATLHIKGERFVAANAGDARVIIGKKEGWEQLTVDHKPDVPDEQARIEGLGGRVIVWGVPRVQGILAMSRALGDASLKPFVTAEPRLVEGLLGRENDIAVLACDGVWDVLDPGEVIALARAEDDPKKGAESIVARALEAGSSDNITALVLDLRLHTRVLARDVMEIQSVLDMARIPGEAI